MNIKVTVECEHKLKRSVEAGSINSGIAEGMLEDAMLVCPQCRTTWALYLHPARPVDELATREQVTGHGE